MKRVSITAVLAVMMLIFAVAHAQDGQRPGSKPPGDKAGAKPQGPPPSVVVTDMLEAGEAEPMAEFIGSVYFVRTSKVATEVDGVIDRVLYREGQRVNRGERLVLLSTDLLRKTADATQAQYEQAQQELEKARRDFDRVAPLYNAGAISESMYDQYRFNVSGLESRAKAMEADLSRLELQLKKKVIRAPYAGVVISRPVEAGEYVAPGGVVAVMADDSQVDIIVDAPESSLPYLERGRTFDVTAQGKQFKAKLISIVPKGDLATRTFTVKLRMKNRARLFEGMEARAMLPTGPRTKGLLVNRDAVVNFAGMQVIYIVVEGMAKMIPVQIAGYDGMRASVGGPGLQPGMQVVVKGNERLFQGNVPVVVQNAGKGPAKAAQTAPDPIRSTEKP